jgi:hypothetical protein
VRAVRSRKLASQMISRAEKAQVAWLAGMEVDYFVGQLSAW